MCPAILVGTKICQENVQERQIYDATPGLGSQLAHKFHTLCKSKKDNFSGVLLVKKIDLKIGDNLLCASILHTWLSFEDWWM